MNEDELYNLLLDSVSSMEGKNTGSYTNSVVKAIKSWLAHNGIEIKRSIDLSEEGCEYLKDYLKERMREGEEMNPESAIVTRKTRVKPFIRATNIGDTIRGAIRKAGFPWRPYVLRSYFDTQLMLAESKGLVLRDHRQFWMGHKGDIETGTLQTKRSFQKP